MCLDYRLRAHAGNVNKRNVMGKEAVRLLALYGKCIVSNGVCIMYAYIKFALRQFRVPSFQVQLPFFSSTCRTWVYIYIYIVNNLYKLS